MTAHRITHALSYAKNADALLADSFDHAAQQVNVDRELAILREIEGIGPHSARDILGKIGLAIALSERQ